MTTLYYIDNEPAWGEWTSFSQPAGSIARTTEAAWPDRGAFGLRQSNGQAYATKIFAPTIEITPGESVFVGLWIKVRSHATGPNAIDFSLFGYGGGVLAESQPMSDSTRQITPHDDSGALAAGNATYTLDRWEYLAVEIQRADTKAADNGLCRMYRNGQPAATWTGLDNYDLAAQLTSFSIGQLDTDAVFAADFDEVKVSQAYPEPYAPSPQSDYLEPCRVVALYRASDGDSEAFGDYCVEQLGLPMSNLCPLPNATATETLADDATWSAQVEDDLSAWLARHPAIASQAMCFLVGYGVPGYFYRDGELISATARLMHFGAASAATANPLYGRTTRIAKTDLEAAGVYMACRIDADTLAHAKDIVDAAVRVAALPAPGDEDYLVASDSNLTRSLVAQKTRLRRSNAFAGEPAAIAVGDLSTLGSLPATGSRAVAVETAQPADTLRAASNPPADALIAKGWAAAMGLAELSGEQIDPQAFLEIFLAGGAMAEAALSACEYVDGAATPCGAPCMPVAFAQAGFNIYHGLDDEQAIDWSTPVAFARSDDSLYDAPLALAAGLRHVFGIRAVSAYGIEEINTNVLAYADISSGGVLLLPPLPRPSKVVALGQTNETTILTFSCLATSELVPADSFDILSDHGTGMIDTSSPVATVTASNTQQNQFEVTIPPGASPEKLAVRARSGERLGALSRIVTIRATTPVPSITL